MSKLKTKYAPARPITSDSQKKSVKWGLIFKPFFFLLLYFFCAYLYGAVFERAEQESFVCANAEAMKFLTDKPWGELFVLGRWLLIFYKNQWIGGFLLSGLLVAIACQIDSILHLPARLRGLSFLVPIGILFFLVQQGTRVYYMREPSQIVLLPLGFFLLFFILSIALRIVRKKKTIDHQGAWMGYGIAIMAFAALSFYTVKTQENTIALAKMQRMQRMQDWEGMTNLALSLKQPTRPIAAYYAVSLLHQNSLIEGLFNLTFDYPEHYLGENVGNAEYNIFTADCAFAAGLVQPALHDALEKTVVNGPSIYMLKRLAISATLLGRKSLAEKYFSLLEAVPFEEKFIDYYRPMLTDSTRITADPELTKVLSLEPLEDRFEQNYRPPIFLGYNIGLMSGTDAALEPSLATCLYAKNLDLAMVRIKTYLQKGRPLTTILQQAILCYSVRNPHILQQVQIQPYVQQSYETFLREAAPYINDKKALRAKMKENWLGTYMYYYFCENNEKNQVKSGQSAGVN